MHAGTALCKNQPEFIDKAMISDIAFCISHILCILRHLRIPALTVRHYASGLHSHVHVHVHVNAHVACQG